MQAEAAASSDRQRLSGLSRELESRAAEDSDALLRLQETLAAQQEELQRWVSGFAWACTCAVCFVQTWHANSCWCLMHSLSVAPCAAGLSESMPRLLPSWLQTVKQCAGSRRP